MTKEIIPTGRPHQFFVREHFEFEGKPAHEDHTVYYTVDCALFNKAIAVVGSDGIYVGAGEINVDGKTYFFPKFEDANP